MMGTKIRACSHKNVTAQTFHVYCGKNSSGVITEVKTENEYDQKKTCQPKENASEIVSK